MILLHSEENQQSLGYGNAVKEKRASKLKFRKTALAAVLAAAFVSISSAQAARFTDTTFSGNEVIDPPVTSNKVWQWNGEHSGDAGYMTAGSSITVTGGTDIDVISTNTDLELAGTAENKITISNGSGGYATGIIIEGSAPSKSPEILIDYATITADSSKQAAAIVVKKLTVDDLNLAPVFTIKNSEIYGAAAAFYNWNAVGKVAYTQAVNISNSLLVANSNGGSAFGVIFNGNSELGSLSITDGSTIRYEANGTTATYDRAAIRNNKNTIGSIFVSDSTIVAGDTYDEETGAWSGEYTASAITNECDGGGCSDPASITTIVLNNSVVSSNAAAIQNEQKIGTITVTNGTHVNSSQTEFEVGGDKFLNNTSGATIDKVKIDGNSIVGKTDNAGTISEIEVTNGSQAGDITNTGTGTIGQLTVGNGAKVTKVTSSNGDMTVNLTGGTDAIGEYDISAGTLTIEHTGNSTQNGGKVTLSGDGKLNITNMNVSIADNKNSDRFTVSGSNGTNVSVEKFTVTSFGNADLSKDVNLHVVVDDTGAAVEAGYAKEAILSESLTNAGFGGNYDAATGMFSATLDATHGASSVMSQLMISQLVRRDYFIDTALAEASQEALLNHTDSSVFVKPYFGYETFDLSGGLNASSHTQGFVAGFTKNWNQAQVLSAYFGYETMDSSAASMFAIDSSMAYAGVDYTNTFASSDELSLYLKGRATFAYLENEIDRMMDGKTSSASPKSLAYSANFYFGGNWHVTPSTVINPEIGLSYLGGHTESFDMGGDIDAIRHEKYDSLNVDLFFADASLSWEQNWHEHFRTRVSGGVRYLFNDDYDVDASINGLYDQANVDLPSLYKYASASIIVSPNKNVDLAFTYAGIFDSMGHSHNAIAKFQYNF